MRAAKQLLEMLTIAFPPPQGAKHAIVVHGGSLHVVLAWADPIQEVSAFQNFTLEDADLDRPANDLLADIAQLLANGPISPIIEANSLKAKD